MPPLAAHAPLPWAPYLRAAIAATIVIFANKCLQIRDKELRAKRDTLQAGGAVYVPTAQELKDQNELLRLQKEIQAGKDSKKRDAAPPAADAEKDQEARTKRGGVALCVKSIADTNVQLLDLMRQTSPADVAVAGYFEQLAAEKADPFMFKQERLYKSYKDGKISEHHYQTLYAKLLESSFL